MQSSAYFAFIEFGSNDFLQEDDLVLEDLQAHMHRVKHFFFFASNLVLNSFV